MEVRPGRRRFSALLPWTWGPAWAFAVIGLLTGIAYGWLARPGWLAPVVVAVLGVAVFASGFDAHHEPSPDGDLVPLAIFILHGILALGACLGAALRWTRRGPEPDAHPPSNAEDAQSL